MRPLLRPGALRPLMARTYHRAPPSSTPTPIRTPRARLPLPTLLIGGLFGFGGALLGDYAAEHYTPFGEIDETLLSHPASRDPSAATSTILPWMLHHPLYQSLVQSPQHHMPAALPATTASEIQHTPFATVLPSRPPGPSLTSGAWRGDKRIQGSVCITGRNPMDADKPFTVMMLDLGPAMCGYPGVIHGGVTATVVDEALGRLAALALGDGRRPVTANLKVTYRKPIRVERHYVMSPEETVDGKDGKGGTGNPRYGARVVVISTVERMEKEKGKVWVKTEVLPAEGVLHSLARIAAGRTDKMALASAEALFVVPRGFKPPPIAGETGGLGSD